MMDWESAFAADRYADLAAIANFYAVNRYDEEMVLRLYFGENLSDYQRARAFLIQPLNRMFYAMVLLNAVATAKPHTRLTAANLTTPRFGEVRGDLSTAGDARGAPAFRLRVSQRDEVAPAKPALRRGARDRRRWLTGY